MSKDAVSISQDRQGQCKRPAVARPRRYGRLYQARDTKLNRTVALRVIPEELVADAERKRRFVLEAQSQLKG